MPPNRLNIDDYNAQVILLKFLGIFQYFGINCLFLRAWIFTLLITRIFLFCRLWIFWLQQWHHKDVAIKWKIHWASGCSLRSSLGRADRTYQAPRAEADFEPAVFWDVQTAGQQSQGVVYSSSDSNPQWASSCMYYKLPKKLNGK
jgi:hypothetical protein